jgi:hypothetical protein
MCSAGCAIGGPKTRLGSLPFPGALTLWDTADPHSLGGHVHEPAAFGGFGESSRGTIYTCKAGFIDVAHLRESADWTKYAYDEVVAALDAGDTELHLTDGYKAEYRMKLMVPPAWSRFSAEARRNATERAARNAAQRIAYLAMTWHEVATWFGERIIPFIPEDRSSFTYDDTIAHVIGVRLGGEALLLVSRGDAADFDSAMTIVLDREIERLGALSTDETYDAALAVEGVWWEGETCTKRQLATGLDEGFLAPWVIEESGRSFAPCAGSEPEVQRLAWEEIATLRSLSDVLGALDMRSASYSETLGFTLGTPPCDIEGWVPSRLFMARCIETLHRDMASKFGEAFDRPSAK